MIFDWREKMKHFVFYTGLVALVLLMTVSAWAAEPDLVIYFNFETIDGDIIPDASGKGHDGKINGDIVLVPGVHGNAAKFSQGSFLDLDGANFPAEDIPVDAWTICAWVNIEDTGEHHAIFNARANDEQWLTHPEIRNADNQYRWLLRTDNSIGGTIFDIRAGEPKVGEWVHFAGTYSRADGFGILYIDGQEVGREEARIPDAPVAGDWSMGARVGINIDDARPFTGLMDDLIISKRALSQDEIQIIMDVGPTAVSSQGKSTTTWADIKEL
jgi:hypothetical protein